MPTRSYLVQVEPAVTCGLGTEARVERLGIEWPDGRRLSPEQREETMQAVIAWGEMHLPPHERVGYIDRGSKQAGQTCDDAQVLRFGEPRSG